MKKFLIALTILISTPLFTPASCPIDGETNACSIAQFSQKPLVPTYSPSSNLREFSGTPEARLKPAEKIRPENQLRTFGSQPTNYSYNSSCQFGVCSSTGTPQLFEQSNQNQK